MRLYQMEEKDPVKRNEGRPKQADPTLGEQTDLLKLAKQNHSILDWMSEFLL